MTPQETPGLTSSAAGGAERVSGGSSKREAVRGPHGGSVEIVIPAPAMFINSNDRRHRMAEAKLTKAWRQAAYVACRNIGPLNWPVQITVEVWKPRANRYDPGNLYPTAKACLDGIVDAGLLPDDSYKQVHGPDMRHGGKGEASLVLKIREIPGFSGRIETAPEVLETPPGA